MSRPAAVRIDDLAGPTYPPEIVALREAVVPMAQDMPAVAAVRGEPRARAAGGSGGQPKIAIELDGGEGHRHEKAFEDDPIRNNRLVVEGWIVLHFTWTRFAEDPAGVLAEVLAAIKLRSGAR